MKLNDIIFEASNGISFVYRNKADKCYFVMVNELTHSKSICAFALDDDGLSCAIAYCKYIDNRKKRN